MTDEEINMIMECMDNSFEITFQKMQKEIVRRVSSKIYGIDGSPYYDRTGQFMEAVELCG